MVTISEKELSIIAQLTKELVQLSTGPVNVSELFGALLFELYAFRGNYGKDEALIGEDACTPTTKNH